MKRRVINLFLLLLFLTGVAFFLYPTVSDEWNRYRNKKLITTYRSVVKDMDGADREIQLKKAQEYNKYHTCNIIRDVFDEKGKYQEESSYGRLLDPNGDGIMGYVEIPKIHVKLAIYHGTSMKTLEKGVGHVEGTSLPVGGEGTHAVLSAHRGLPSAKLFTDLDQMEVGDEFYVSVLNQINAYKVDQILTVLPSETEPLAIQKHRDYITLLTCTPYAVNTHRLLVRGHRVPYDSSKYIKEDTVAKEDGRDQKRIWLLLAAVLIGGMVVGLIWRSNSNHED